MFYQMIQLGIGIINSIKIQDTIQFISFTETRRVYSNIMDITIHNTMKLVKRYKLEEIGIS